MPEHDALAAIKARHAELRALVNNPETTELRKADMGGAGFEQIGLGGVMVDGFGRLWNVSCDPMRMVFDPHGADTQAAHGFKSHEG